MEGKSKTQRAGVFLLVVVLLSERLFAAPSIQIWTIKLVLFSFWAQNFDDFPPWAKWLKLMPFLCDPKDLITPRDLFLTFYATHTHTHIDTLFSLCLPLLFLSPHHCLHCFLQTIGKKIPFRLLFAGILSNRSVWAFVRACCVVRRKKAIFNLLTQVNHNLCFPTVIRVLLWLLWNQSVQSKTPRT